MTCFSRLHYRHNLYCALHRGPAVRVCKDFDYTPGSDEAVRDEA